MSKRLSKYIASSESFDKSLIVLSVVTGSISIASFGTVIGAPIGIISGNFSLASSISIGIIKKLLKIRNKKKKHNKIVMLLRSKLNSIESKISEALINNEISHEDFITIINCAAANNTNKKVIFKNCAPFTDCISKIDNTQVDNAKGIDIGMPMYNLIEYNDNYSIKSGSLWQYCKDIPPVNDNGNIVDFNGANATDSFNFKTKITGQTDKNGRINVEIMVPLKYLRNFWRTLEMPLINCEVNVIVTWPADCIINYTNVANQVLTFAITETNLYVPVVTL